MSKIYIAIINKKACGFSDKKESIERYLNACADFLIEKEKKEQFEIVKEDKLATQHTIEVFIKQKGYFYDSPLKKIYTIRWKEIPKVSF